MKKEFLLVGILLLISILLFGQVDTIGKQVDTIGKQVDAIGKQVDAIAKQEDTLGKYRTFAAIIGAIIIMLVGMWLVFDRLKENKTGFDTNSIKALGIVLFVPTLILAFSVKAGISSEALSALLGTVAGYILSRSTNGAEK